MALVCNRWRSFSECSVNCRVNRVVDYVFLLLIHISALEKLTLRLNALDRGDKNVPDIRETLNENNFLADWILVIKLMQAGYPAQLRQLFCSTREPPRAGIYMIPLHRAPSSAHPPAATSIFINYHSRICLAICDPGVFRIHHAVHEAEMSAHAHPHRTQPYPIPSDFPSDG